MVRDYERHVPRRRRGVDLLKVQQIERDRPAPRSPLDRWVIKAWGLSKPLVRLYDAFNGCCHYCGIRTTKDTDDRSRWPTRDHRLARSRGGSDHRDNKVLACGWCNGKKGVMTEPEFLDWLELHPRPGSAMPGYDSS